MTPKQVTRFHEQVEKRGPDDCWYWIPTLMGSTPNYPIDGATASVGKVAYMLSHPEWNGIGFMIGHTCHCNYCCNPAHLIVKSRKGSGRGLNDTKVKLILESDDPFEDLAKKYDVAPQVIHRIKNGWTWKHIPRKKPVPRRYTEQETNALQESFGLQSVVLNKLNTLR